MYVILFTFIKSTFVCYSWSDTGTWLSINYILSNMVKGEVGPRPHVFVELCLIIFFFSIKKKKDKRIRKRHNFSLGIVEYPWRDAINEKNVLERNKVGKHLSISLFFDIWLYTSFQCQNLLYHNCSTHSTIF